MVGAVHFPQILREFLFSALRNQFGIFDLDIHSGDLSFQPFQFPSDQ